ncbi:interleukin-17F-like [Amia ocellicauda]|uniref:interleukin-17F-like n=1 Tax=Amia ocellicauda TaxID=2972642 RepID=UPI0034649216
MPLTQKTGAVMLLKLAVLPIVLLVLGAEGAHIAKARKDCHHSDSQKVVQVALDFSVNSRVTMSRNAASRSLSPWTYSQPAGDTGVFPQYHQVVCQHQGCVKDGELLMGYNSVPIIQDVLVLRRVKDKCGYMFLLETRNVTLGCTCVKADVTMQHQL